MMTGSVADYRPIARWNPETTGRLCPFQYWLDRSDLPGATIGGPVLIDSVGIVEIDADTALIVAELNDGRYASGRALWGLHADDAALLASDPHEFLRVMLYGAMHWLEVPLVA